MRKGDFEILYMKGANGYLIMLSLGEINAFEIIVILSTAKDIILSDISPENLRLIAKEGVLYILEDQWGRFLS